MKEEVTAIFDIGKTNKKFFLFNADFEEVYREYASFELIKDEDGHPTEDLAVLQSWMKAVFERILKTKSTTLMGLTF